MDLELTNTQQRILKTAWEFATSVVAPRASEIDRTSTFPRDLFREAAGRGLAGITSPARFGGGGHGVLACALAIEEISRYCASTGAILAIHNLSVCDAVNEAGTDEQKERFLRRLASGEWLGAYCLSEPEAGSDLASLQASAQRVGEGYRLAGTKSWVTSAVSADVFLVYARVEPGRGGEDVSAFLVERDRPGLRVLEAAASLGVCGSGCADLVLDGCDVPEANRLGKEGAGLSIALQAMDAGRIGAAAQALGIARAALEDSLAYAQERRQFGQPISESQAVQWMLADMATEIDAARILTWKAAWAKDAGASCTLEAAVAKLTASEACVRAAGNGIRVLGAKGYSKQRAMERYFRDSKVTEIYQGTSEMQRLAIASQILQ